MYKNLAIKCNNDAEKETVIKILVDLGFDDDSTIYSHHPDYPYVGANEYGFIGSYEEKIVVKIKKQIVQFDEFINMVTN